MDATASSFLINNLATTVILNFNLQVFVNLFLYSAAATTGVLATSRVITFLVEESISALRYKWTSRYNRRIEDIKELNNKISDRLVEIKNAIETRKADKKAKEARTRLLYCAARLKKYDRTISDDIDLLFKNVSFKNEDTVEIKDVRQSKLLIDRIRSKVDKLWFGMG